jgi:hypothetical protein
VGRTQRVTGILDLALIPVTWIAFEIGQRACDFDCGDAGYRGGFFLLMFLSVVTAPLAVCAIVSPFPSGRPSSRLQRGASRTLAGVLIVTACLLTATAVGAYLDSLS